MARQKKGESKVMSLRLDEELWKEIAAVARVDDHAVSEAIREAIEKHIASRGGDREFQIRVKEKLEEDIATVRRLAERLDEPGGTAGDKG
jgi:predicted DNA-binding protein